MTLLWKALSFKRTYVRPYRIARSLAITSIPVVVCVQPLCALESCRKRWLTVGMSTLVDHVIGKELKEK